MITLVYYIQAYSGNQINELLLENRILTLESIHQIIILPFFPHFDN
jgi:hypothetical protein